MHGSVRGAGERAEPEQLEPWEQPGLGELFRPTEEVFGKAVPASASPTVAAAPAAVPGEVVPLNSMRKAIAEHMVMSRRTSPHVTTVFEVDLSRVVAHRTTNKSAFERDAANLTFTPYFALATIAALKKYPLDNSSWSESGIVLHRAVNLGIAVSLGAEGLIVPVIKNADSLNLLGLARTVKDLADRARRKRLKPDEVQDGTFTLTNHGVSGSLFATPIINQPQCGILGVAMIETNALLAVVGVTHTIIQPIVHGETRLITLYTKKADSALGRVPGMNDMTVAALKKIGIMTALGLLTADRSTLPMALENPDALIASAKKLLFP